MHEALKDLPQGWFHHGEHILQLLEDYRPSRCVELGTWRGASAIAIARVIRQWGGTLTCIDTWTGEVPEGQWGTVAGPPVMLLECATNVIQAGLAGVVHFIPALTQEAARHWRGGIDFLYVDADHSYASVKADLVAWWPLLGLGGLLCGDDYDNPLYPSLNQAWDEFEREIGIVLHRDETVGTKFPGMKLIWGLKEEPSGVH